MGIFMKNRLNVAFQGHILSNYNAGLTKALQRVGIMINLFTSDYKSYDLQSGNISNFPLSNVLNFLALPERLKNLFKEYSMDPWLLRNLKEKNISLIHVNVASSCDAFLKASRRYSIPIVYTNHYAPEPEPLYDPNLDPYTSSHEKEILLIPNLSENSFRVIAVSEYARKTLKREFGIDSEVIYHGVDSMMFNPALLRVKRKYLGIEGTEKMVLWVSRFGHHPYKDPFTFIRAACLVLKKYPNTKFIMIGKGPLQTYAKFLASKLRLGSSLKFVSNVENLNLFYAASDVFVSTSYNDNFGLVVAEAMACGKPVVTSDRGATPEVRGDAGLAFKYGCHEDLADQIILMFENEDLAEKLGAKAYERILQNFTWERAAEKYLSLYKKAA